MTSPRIIMLARSGDSTSIIYNALRHHFQIERVILEEPVSRWQFMKNRAKKMGWFYVGGQAVFQAVVAKVLGALSKGRKNAIIAEFGLNLTPPPADVVTQVDSANSDQTIELIKSIKPDLVVINGTRIISKRVLAATDSPFVNMHAGITPLYRGVHGGYWALAQNDLQNCGVTVHLVDAGIDTGNILGQALIKPTSADNFTTYPLLQVAAGLPKLVEAVGRLLQGDKTTLPNPPGKSALWSHPTVWEYLANRLKGVK